MDQVFVHGLSVETVIGVFDWERQITQTVIIDLDMAADVAKAARTDDLESTLDYKALSKRVIAFVKDSRFKLVETLAEGVADLILNEFGVPWVRVKLNKRGAITGAHDVGVIIERGELRR